MFICFLFLSPLSEASFRQVNLRYLMPGDFALKLLAFFPHALRKDSQYPYNWNLQCLLLDEKSAPSYGAIDALSGRPLSGVPDLSFLNNFGACAEKTISSEFEIVDLVFGNMRPHSKGEKRAAEESLKTFFSILKRFKSFDRVSDNRSFYNKLVSLRWSDLSATERLGFVEHLTHLCLGPDVVISEYGRSTGATPIANELLPNILSNQNIIEVTKSILNRLALRDEFLMY